MENISKTGTVKVSLSKAGHTVGLIIIAVIVCRCNLLEGSFTVGISFITYMISKNTINLYLLLPAAAGLIPYEAKGWDIWPYMAALTVCGLVITAFKKKRLKLWQQAVIASTTAIIIMSVYRFATGTVYMTSPEKLVIEGVLIGAGIYLFEAFFFIIEKSSDCRIDLNTASVSCVIVIIMAINGMGLSFLTWMAAIFLVVWVLNCVDMGQALLVTAVGGTAAALLGEGNWGMMATVILAVAAASLFDDRGKIIKTSVFVIVCLFAGTIESGIVLGVDRLCLAIPIAVFTVMYWRFGEGMDRIACMFAGEKESIAERNDKYIQKILRKVSHRMNDLAELYETYLDSRSIFANQFCITGQIVDSLRKRVYEGAGENEIASGRKLGIEVAISQCAAGGRINGDCCGWQESEDGKIIMVVSDGMGKGKKAAAESLMVTKTMLSLLTSGVDVEMALKMINTIMIVKDDEDSYATLDMVMLDTNTGKAKFYKIGAAPTLIRRKNNVEEVKLSAVPLGIVNGLKIHYVETVLKKGDWIIMMSDGVSDGGDARRGVTGTKAGSFGLLEKIKETAAGIRSSDPQTMSDLILNRAADSYMGMERDDLTVMVARIL